MRYLWQTPLWLYWKLYYKLLGRPLPCKDSQGSLRAVRRLTPPWWKPQEPKTHNAWLRAKLREDAFMRKVMLPEPPPDERLPTNPWLLGQVKGSDAPWTGKTS